MHICILQAARIVAQMQVRESSQILAIGSKDPKAPEEGHRDMVK
jgi:hypothetical protein